MRVGRVEEYNESKEDFESYLERLEQRMLANDVSDEKKLCMFLSVIGADTFRLLKNLVSPRVPSTVGYAVLTEAFSAHYKPTPVVIAERFRFQKPNQKEADSVSDYVVALRQLSVTCNFEQYLDEALRDRFVSELRSDAVQRKLLLEMKSAGLGPRWRVGAVAGWLLCCLGLLLIPYPTLLLVTCSIMLYCGHLCAFCAEEFFCFLLSCCPL
uniref:Retrotransposon gag domain-containing protein n=1 Tax=Pundamilia nyererei TaxID=303518 RepID=A0A3B4H7P2_9CICH